MPICDNNNSKSKSIVTTDVDHQAENAKAKISREQAYFNSYDFDAIEVLPLDEDEEGDLNCDYIKRAADAGICSDLDSQVVSTGVYLKRLTSYLTAATRIRHLNKINESSSSLATANVVGEESQNQSVHSNCSSCSRNSSRKLYNLGNDDNNHGARNSFLLPRAMLKYQSAVESNSMSASGLTACTTSITKVAAVTSGTKSNCRIIDHSRKSNANISNSGFVQCYEKSSDRERVISTSHYSTDKSGSSGYYSSNVCSTSSVDDHIYSEPAVDAIETRLAALKQFTLPLRKTIGKPRQGTIRPATRESYYNVEVHTGEVHSGEISEELRLLERSIKNLDQHLKSYPSANICSRRSSLCTAPDEDNSVQNYDKSKHPRPMPTIMEGTDTQSIEKTPPSWSDDMYDSLRDIDLDSFLLVNEMGPKGTKTIKTRAGIDNPTFNKTKVLNEEFLENNYKCSKYVNSCPEDAYKVESVIDSLVHVGGQNTQDKSLAFFLQKYEDQIHFQSTKDMIEDIRSKVNSLTNNSPGDSKKSGHQAIPKDLEKHIAILKVELETYLRIINHSNEMEIKKLCTGLVNDQKLMTITKAFERRKSLASDSEFTYDLIRPSSYSTLPYANVGRDDCGTVACCDPNFQLKRKSAEDSSNSSNCPVIISDESFGDDDGTKKSASFSSGSLDSKTELNVTQLQKNLSFQRPMLDKRSKCEGDKDTMLEWHKNKPSIWELYYGTNRINQTLTGKRGQLVKNGSIFSYPSSRPESDFTLDLPRAEQLRLRMENEKKFRKRCRILTTFLSLVFFLLTVMVVSLILTRGKRMFGSML